jgi:hypothetical protein
MFLPVAPGRVRTATWLTPSQMRGAITKASELSSAFGNPRNL